MKFIILFACCLALQLATAEKQPFDRYQSILDRQMFGPLPPGFDPTKLPSEVSKSSSATEKQLTQEQEKLQSAIHFSMINLTPEGETEVGFTDNSDPKVPVNYLLKVGESRNGWTVKAADAVAATMTIAKGEIEVSLTLGGNSASQANATARSGGAAPAGMARPAGLAPGRPGLLGGSLRARRLQRQQAAAADEAKRKEEQAARDAERQAQAEQEKAQREAERAEQRQQLLAIQEELKRVRESKAAAAKSEEESNADN